ncbi:uncharacterized protein MONBRDRAFT_29806 [Monosiga brevicollis MX1]|uniref:Uncharacterized protein n=1 Tax=Monosiga brevicollis TaxID=81824 RepID=A9VC64_MONBE|nr:uncharacterized protein MONBRDRAFT_29806 [Monosiga brevicollis MX1]EDQ84806.1 predicted protein [Monosiga brevicollis MX1]|eukprot:XP_001750307.1 hypothetical protein [Monosiga brevicollis MX1]
MVTVFRSPARRQNEAATTNQDGLDLFAACQAEDSQPAMSLLTNWSDEQIAAAVKYRNSGTDSLLHRACSAGHVGIVRLLLARDDVDVNAEDIYRNTPLHIACTHGNLDIVRLLLENTGLNTEPKNQGGRTPLDVATSNLFLSWPRLMHERSLHTKPRLSVLVRKTMEIIVMTTRSGAGNTKNLQLWSIMHFYTRMKSGWGRAEDATQKLEPSKTPYQAYQARSYKRRHWHRDK